MEHFIFDLLKTRRGRVVVALIAVALGTMFCLIAYPDLREHWRLRRSTAVADGQVVETRTSSGMHFETHHDLRYRFRVPGRPERFTHCEKGTGRSDLWAQVRREDWERSRASGRIDVAYLPDDPAVNCPAAMRTAAATDVTAGMAMGAALLGGGAIALGVMAGRAAVEGRGATRPNASVARAVRSRGSAA